jgi:hypothetical protein
MSANSANVFGKDHGHPSLLLPEALERGFYALDGSLSMPGIARRRLHFFRRQGSVDQKLKQEGLGLPEPSLLVFIIGFDGFGLSQDVASVAFDDAAPCDNRGDDFWIGIKGDVSSPYSNPPSCRTICLDYSLTVNRSPKTTNGSL